METGIERDLIVNLELPFNPRWSTDGRSIFLRGSDSKGLTGLFQIDVQTGGVTPFLVRPELWLASFAPNGSALYFNRNGVDYDKGIVKRDLTTGQETQLTSGIPYGLALSPDGDYLAYSIPAKNSVQTIMVVPPSGGTAREITQMNQLGDVSLAWTRDGRFLLFTKPNKDVSELWRVSIDGKQAESVGVTMRALTHLNIHPDGKQIAFTGGEFNQEIWVMENFLPKEGGVKK